LPGYVDDDSGYRYYNEGSLDRAKIIMKLKEFDFSLNEIKDIIANYDDDSDIIKYFQVKAQEIRQKINKFKEIQKQINLFIKIEEEVKMVNKDKEIVIKDVSDILIASIRYEGTYSEIGKAFKEIFKTARSNVNGAPFALYYDEGYMEKDADIEACIPVKKEINKGKISSKILKGGTAHTILHQGPYDTVGEAYKKISDYANKHEIKLNAPCREIYLKGPGMIFRGNPKKYLTEIQFIS
jgi:effector-binding domain-containing protein